MTRLSLIFFLFLERGLVRMMSDDDDTSIFMFSDRRSVPRSMSLIQHSRYVVLN